MLSASHSSFIIASRRFALRKSPVGVTGEFLEGPVLMGGNWTPLTGDLA